MQEERVTFAQIQNVFDSFLLMKDRDFIRLTMAVIIGNQIKSRRPIWLMLVAPPSSGKTTALNALIGLEVTNQKGEKVHPTESISDITEKTFASGARRSDKETSLLYRLPFGGVLMFKDFTSILSKRDEEKRSIMAQLREIYDGAYNKKFGTGDEVDWKGKVGAIGGVTQAIYQHLESMSVMGDRFMLYQIPQPDRKATLKFKLQQERLGTTEDIQMPIAQDLVQRYMQQAFDTLDDVKVVLDDKTEDEIIAVADFCTMVRSGIIHHNFSGEIQFVPDAEMPARMFEQMLALASTFLLMQLIDNPGCKPELGKQDFKLMYKIAYDSIPAVRRIALKYLAQYSQGVSTTGLALRTNYPSGVVKGWLEQLNALGIVARVKRGSGENWWRLQPQYREIMVKLQDVAVIDEWMDSDGSEYEEAEAEWTKDKAREIDDVAILQEKIDNEDW